jgi:hypothetical protein
MRTVRTCGALLVVLLILCPAPLGAQAVDTVGTRARGMGNAFVGVADDASAVYWNPAGLAGGAFFSLLVDGGGAEALPAQRPEAGRRSSWLLAASMPALGLAYYRLGRDAVAEVVTPEGRAVRRDALVTHHAGASLVQSLTDHIAVGVTLKGVRGIAASAVLPTTDRAQALEQASLIGRSGTRFDVDAGIMASGQFGRLGLTVRNVTEPSFDTGAAAEDRSLRLDREVRAGGSVLLLPSWRLASDVDLTRQRGPVGDVREWAVGSEAQVTRRMAARAGFRLNMAGDAGRAPALSAGGSYLVYSGLMLDAQVTGGSDAALRGWGVAGRMVF